MKIILHDGKTKAQLWVERLRAKITYWGSRCYVCGDPWNIYFHFHHVKPKSAGGSDLMGNKRPICQQCNYRKGNKLDFIPGILFTVNPGLKKTRAVGHKSPAWDKAKRASKSALSRIIDSHSRAK